MDEKITGWIDRILETGIDWGNKAIEFFGLYTSKYSKWLVVALIVWIASQAVSIKGVLGGGGKK